MLLYSGPEDTAWVHPEEVSSKTVAMWLKSIIGNQDNPRGSRRVIPFTDDNPPDKVCSLFRLPGVYVPTVLDVDRLLLDFLSCRFSLICI